MGCWHLNPGPQDDWCRQIHGAKLLKFQVGHEFKPLRQILYGYFFALNYCKNFVLCLKRSKNEKGARFVKKTHFLILFSSAFPCPGNGRSHLRRFGVAATCPERAEIRP